MPNSPPPFAATSFALARQKIGDQPPALLGDFGQMPGQFGLIHLVSPTAVARCSGTGPVLSGSGALFGSRVAHSACPRASGR